MQLNELLEKHSIRTISERTMISEDNIKRIVAEDFTSLSKAKALGFLSILEREYNLDSKNVKKNIAAYYDSLGNDEQMINITHPAVEEKKGRSKWFFFLILALLAYASWYFFTQFDNKTLSTLMPLSEDESAVPFVENNKSTEKSESIKNKNQINREAFGSEDSTQKNDNTLSETNNSASSNTLPEVVKDATDTEPNIVVMDIVPDKNTTPDMDRAMSVSTEVTKEVNISTEDHVSIAQESTENVSKEENQSEKTEETVVQETTKVILKPVKRLWFGLVNMRTGKRDHFSIRKPFTIDLTKGNWLVATSPAPFSLIFNDDTKLYRNGREHYFIITKKGITALRKRAYVRKGGYRKW